MAGTARHIRGRSNSVERKEWQRWLDSAANLAARFWHELCEDPFAYNETASVSLLSAAAARIGYLGLAEFNVTKKSRRDRRCKARGRSDFWMTSDRREWSFEFKQITDGPITSRRLRAKMKAAADCVAHLRRYGAEHMVAGLVVSLYWVDEEATREAKKRLRAHAAACDHAWIVKADREAPDTFLFFDIVERGSA